MGATATHVDDVRYFNAGPTWPAGWAARCECGWRAGRPFDSMLSAHLAHAAHVELIKAQAACERARFAEQHRDDCKWCAHLAPVDVDRGDFDGVAALPSDVGLSESDA